MEPADMTALCALKLAEDQRRFVAPNAVTIDEAKGESACHVFTIWDGDTRVGLIALVDMPELDQTDVAPHDEPQSVLIWRFMIAEAHQRRGFGAAAVAWALDWARSKGRPRMSVEVVETNAPAIALYERFGFRATGVLYGDEAQMARDL